MVDRFFEGGEAKRNLTYSEVTLDSQREGLLTYREEGP